MWCCPFPVYISDNKFLIWLRYGSCFRLSDKSGYLIYIQFNKLLWLWFSVAFVLNLGFYCNDVEQWSPNFSRSDPNFKKVCKYSRPQFKKKYASTRDHKVCTDSLHKNIFNNNKNMFLQFNINTSVKNAPA